MKTKQSETIVSVVDSYLNLLLFIGEYDQVIDLCGDLLDLIMERFMEAQVKIQDGR